MSTGEQHSRRGRRRVGNWASKQDNNFPILLFNSHRIVLQGWHCIAFRSNPSRHTIMESYWAGHHPHQSAREVPLERTIELWQPNFYYAVHFDSRFVRHGPSAPAPVPADRPTIYVRIWECGRTNERTNVRPRVEIAESNNGANFGNYIRWKLNGNFRKLISAPCAWKIQSQSHPSRVVINDKFVTLYPSVVGVSTSSQPHQLLFGSTIWGQGYRDGISRSRGG